MTPLPLKGTPSELHPFITSINGLLARMRLLMDQHRRFVADAAHELRTPITALSLQAENLDVGRAPQAARGSALPRSRRVCTAPSISLSNCSRWRGMRQSPPALPKCRLRRWTVWRKRSWPICCRRRLDRGIDLGFALVEPLMVRSEPVMLAAIIRNLLDNALRFTPRGGTIDIGVYREDDVAILQVEDTGPGIASTDMDQDLRAVLPRLAPGGRGNRSWLVHREAHCRQPGRRNRAGEHRGRRPVGAPCHGSAADCRRSGFNGQQRRGASEKPNGSGTGVLLSRS